MFRDAERPRHRGRRFALAAPLAVSLALAVPASASAIVGGEVAPPGRWPWMAAVLDAGVSDAGRAQYCGGVVIGRRRVLTAAHCVAGERSRDVEVLIGRTRLSEAGGRRVRVASISVHPALKLRRRSTLDAAVLSLAEDAGVPPLALARPGQQAAWAPGTAAWTMGWGQLNARPSPGGNRYYADRLRELEVPVYGDDTCESAYGIGFNGFPYRPGSVLCAGRSDALTGPCMGDSGGPLVVGGPDGWLDVGVLHGGDSCAARAYPELYTRVDRISAFALGAHLARQPDPVGRPRIAGPALAGALVRCSRGRWRGSPARFSTRWTRLGDRTGRVRGRGVAYRLRRRDVRKGVRCSVTAVNRGGRITVASRPLRRRR